MEIGIDTFDLVALRVCPVIVRMCQQWFAVRPEAVFLVVCDPSVNEL